MSLFLVLACTVADSSTVLHCDLTGPLLEPAEAEPGVSVRAVSRPMTEVWDTSVYVGGTPAAVTAVERVECDACDTCREEAECNVCDSCTDCAADCAPCVESATFTVPQLAPGPHAVVLTNLHASASAVVLTVTAADTGDSGDSGDTDSGDTAAAP